MKSVVEELASKFVELGAVSAVLKEEKFIEICPSIQDENIDKNLLDNFSKIEWVFKNKESFTFYKDKK